MCTFFSIMDKTNKKTKKYPPPWLESISQSEMYENSNTCYNNQLTPGFKAHFD